MVIAVKNLTYRYSYNHVVLHDLTFEVKQGEFWGILGRNGAGKTTLLDLVMGMKAPTEGQIRVFDEDPNSLTGVHQRDVTYISQDIKLKGDVRIDDFLTYHRPFCYNYSLELEKELIDFFKMNREYKIGALSTGQQKKVQIIAALASNTKLILIDEITAVLDPETRFHFFTKILEYNKRFQKTFILATNIAEDLQARANNILYINGAIGEVVSPSRINTLFQIK